MDILTALEAAHCPLTLKELQEYCGVMFSKERLDTFIRSGDIKTVPGLNDVYWAVPPSLRKRNTYKKCNSPMKVAERSSVIRDISNFREKLILITREYDSLREKEDTFPTQEQEKAHIQRLHNYNEIKDTGREVIKHIAELEKVPVKEIYEQFDINDEENN